MDELITMRIKLNTQSLKQIAKAILPELTENYENVKVEVIQCPDLTQPPFNLASEGINGDENVFSIGDLTNILPLIKRDKLYNIKQLKQVTASDPLFVIGPCAGPHPFLGVDSECVMNIKITDDRVKNYSHALSMNESIKKCIHTSLPEDETRFSFMGDFFTSNGFKGEILKIICEIRKGPLSFSTCLSKSLAKTFGDEIVAMGGVLLIENGKVKVHIIKPDLAKKPLETEKDSKNLLHFIEVSPPLVGLGCIMSHDPGLNLRLQHFHLYTDYDEGGHYHNDTEPEIIKYTGYFNVAKQLIKIDQNQGETLPFF